MRRAGVGPWLSTFAAGIFIFFGTGVENVFVAFQITFVGALAFGLGQLLLADHEGALDWRDWLGLLCGLASIMCSGVGLTMVFVVGMAVLLRRGWRLALFHTAPLAIVFVIWLAAAPSGQSTRGCRLRRCLTSSGSWQSGSRRHLLGWVNCEVSGTSSCWSWSSASC